MTLTELIEKLTHCPQDAEVFYSDGQGRRDGLAPVRVPVESVQLVTFAPERMGNPDWRWQGYVRLDGVLRQVDPHRDLEAKVTGSNPV